MPFLYLPLIGITLCILFAPALNAGGPENPQSLPLCMNYVDINDVALQAIETALGQSTCFTSLSLNVTNRMPLIPTSTVADIVANIEAALHHAPHISTLDLKLVCADQNTVQISMIIDALSKILNLSGLTRLKLILPNLNLNNADIEMLVTSLQACVKLKDLNFDLRLNSIDAKGVEALEKTLVQWKDLTHLTLSLSTNHIGITGFEALTKALCPLKNLIHLDLDLGWGPNGSIMRRIAAYFLECYRASINVSDSNHHAQLQQMEQQLNPPADSAMNDKKIHALATVILSLENLTFMTLHLYGNDLRSAEVILLAQALRQSPKLSELGLNMHSNKIDDAGAHAFGIEMSLLTNLQSLYVNLLDNPISSGTTTALKETLQRLPNLRPNKFCFNQD